MTVWCLFDEDDMLLRIFSDRDKAIESARYHLETYTESAPWVGEETERSVNLYSRWYTSATETVKWELIQFEVD